MCECVALLSYSHISTGGLVSKTRSWTRSFSKLNAFLLCVQCVFSVTSGAQKCEQFLLRSVMQEGRCAHQILTSHPGSSATNRGLQWPSDKPANTGTLDGPWCSGSWDWYWTYVARISAWCWNYVVMNVCICFAWCWNFVGWILESSLRLELFKWAHNSTSKCLWLYEERCNTLVGLMLELFLLGCRFDIELGLMLDCWAFCS